jgi:hypothetical protein
VSDRGYPLSAAAYGTYVARSGVLSPFGFAWTGGTRQHETALEAFDEVYNPSKASALHIDVGDI